MAVRPMWNGNARQ